MLRNRRQDVIYNLFDWPSKPNSRFIVLTIANTMDLPERLLKGRVTSRLVSSFLLCLIFLAENICLIHPVFCLFLFDFRDSPVSPSSHILTNSCKKLSCLVYRDLIHLMMMLLNL